MNPILMEYITNVLAPKQYRLELKNRLENLCSLSGSPMSPGLREWVIRTFGLEMVRVIESYSSLTPPVFSPELQQKINRIVPSNYQGYDANLGFNQLFSTSCGPGQCLYVGFIDLNGGASLSDYTLTDNVTPLIDAYGNGYLRTLMQSQQGDVYAPFYDPTNFIFNGIHLYYIGTSANNIDVNFLGSPFGTIGFNSLGDNGIECRPLSCYTMTFPAAYYQLGDIFFSFAPLQILSSNLISSAPFYNYINVTNVGEMTTLITQIYGNSAVYGIVLNGNDTYTITITNAYYFGSNPILTLYNSRSEAYTDTMTDC